MGIDTSKLESHTLSSIAQQLGAEDTLPLIPEYNRKQYLREIGQMSPQQAFICYCQWNGLMGWGAALWDVMHSLESAQDESQ